MLLLNQFISGFKWRGVFSVQRRLLYHYPRWTGLEEEEAEEGGTLCSYKPHAGTLLLGWFREDTHGVPANHHPSWGLLSQRKRTGTWMSFLLDFKLTTPLQTIESLNCPFCPRGLPKATDWGSACKVCPRFTEIAELAGHWNSNEGPQAKAPSPLVVPGSFYCILLWTGGGLLFFTCVSLSVLLPRTEYIKDDLIPRRGMLTISGRVWMLGRLWTSDIINPPRKNRAAEIKSPLPLHLMDGERPANLQSQRKMKMVFLLSPRSSLFHSFKAEFTSWYSHDTSSKLDLPWRRKE